jgi:hypothetical protein
MASFRYGMSHRAWMITTCLRRPFAARLLCGQAGMWRRSLPIMATAQLQSRIRGRSIACVSPVWSSSIRGDSRCPIKRGAGPEEPTPPTRAATLEIVAGRKLRRHYEDVTPRPSDFICDSRRKQQAPRRAVEVTRRDLSRAPRTRRQ